MNERMPKNKTRREFLKEIVAITSGLALSPTNLLSQNQENIAKTRLKTTNEKFRNGESVYTLFNENGERIGEFWPIKGINLVTRTTDPEVFLEKDMKDIQKKLGGVATAPDGMTSGSTGSFVMEGKSLSKGRECGDGQIKNYGIIIVKNGFDITFTHKKEHENDFDSLYNSVKKDNGTLFFLPSIYRNGKFISSNSKIDKVIIRRQVPDGEQLAIILFDNMLTYDEARKAITGLDRPNQSQTTHIYALDGGPNWGQSAKEINGNIIIQGNRDPMVVTNYLVFY